MSQPERYLRFSLGRRIEHWITVLSFTILAATGLPQKYAEAPISQSLLSLFGGIETARLIHRGAAVALMLVAVYHFGTLVYHWYVVRGPLSIMPSLDDVRKAWQALLYNLKKRRQKPKQGFYTFEEKFEYWALIWGTVIMALTGFFLWNPITAARFLPGEWIPAAKAAHGNEALLAVLAILIWHFYHVLVKHFNTSMYTGYMSREEMEELHPLAIEKGEVDFESPPPSDPRLANRKRLFWAGYGVVALAWLAGVYWFVTTEQTAVAAPEEIPDLREIEVYAPLTPTPIPTRFTAEPPADIGATWEDGIGDLLGERCGNCHSPELGKANLDLTSYQGALEGGDSGPAVIPEAPGVSLIVIWQARGDHPGQLTLSEQAAVRSWIENRAPEN